MILQREQIVKESPIISHMRFSGYLQYYKRKHIVSQFIHEFHSDTTVNKDIFFNGRFFSFFSFSFLFFYIIITFFPLHCLQKRGFKYYLFYLLLYWKLQKYTSESAISKIKQKTWQSLVTFIFDFNQLYFWLFSSQISSFI